MANSPYQVANEHFSISVEEYSEVCEQTLIQTVLSKLQVISAPPLPVLKELLG